MSPHIHKRHNRFVRVVQRAIAKADAAHATHLTALRPVKSSDGWPANRFKSSRGGD